MAILIKYFWVRGDVMTKVTPGLLIPDSMGLNAQMRQQQRLDCTIPYPWALIEIYWTWPINGLRHVLRNNQFGPLMNSLEFFLDKRYIKKSEIQSEDHQKSGTRLCYTQYICIASTQLRFERLS